MSWQPADDREERVEPGPPGLEAVPLAGEDVERQGQGEVGRRLVEGIVDGIVIVAHRRVAGHHHAPEAEGPDLAQVLDALLHRAHGRLPDADEPVRMRRAVLGDPPVVGVEAGLLVVEVGMVAEHHADGGVEHLRAHPVHVLVGEARVGVPAAPVHVLESGPEHPERLGGLAGRGHEAHRDGLVHPVDHEQVAPLGVAHHVGRPLAEAPIDPVDVGIRGLGDVRVRRDDGFRHGHALPWDVTASVPGTPNPLTPRPRPPAPCACPCSRRGGARSAPPAPARDLPGCPRAPSAGPRRSRRPAAPRPPSGGRSSPSR